MKKLLIFGLLALMVIGLAPAPLAAAPPIPKPTSSFYVLDQADVLSSQTESVIVGTSRQLADKTKAQVVVVTVKSLEDYSVEEYALEILRQWGIGDKQLNNGVLLLLSLNDRKARIEVGYGLEGALPDGKTGRIQDEYMLPFFQQGDYNQGVLNGYLALVQEVAKEYQVTIQAEPARAPATGTNTTQEPMPTWLYILGMIGLIVLFYLDFRYMNGFFFGLLMGILLRGGGRGGGGGSRGGGGSGGGGGSSRGW